MGSITRRQEQEDMLQEVSGRRGRIRTQTDVNPGAGSVKVEALIEVENIAAF